MNSDKVPSFVSARPKRDSPDLVELLLGFSPTVTTIEQIDWPQAETLRDRLTDLINEHQADVTKWAQAPLTEVYAPYPAQCGAEVWGTPRDIDSGLRKHAESCEACQQASAETEA
jgi:hypothetical protein